MGLQSSSTLITLLMRTVVWIFKNPRLVADIANKMYQIISAISIARTAVEAFSAVSDDDMQDMRKAATVFMKNKTLDDVAMMGSSGSRLLALSLFQALTIAKNKGELTNADVYYLEKALGLTLEQLSHSKITHPVISAVSDRFERSFEFTRMLNADETGIYMPLSKAKELFVDIESGAFVVGSGPDDFKMRTEVLAQYLNPGNVFKQPIYTSSYNNELEKQKKAAQEPYHK